MLHCLSAANFAYKYYIWLSFYNMSDDQIVNDYMKISIGEDTVTGFAYNLLQKR